MNSPEPPGLSEYHARQRALDAENQAQSAAASASSVRRALREIEKRLEAALARLDEGDVSGARGEIRDALDRVERA